MNVGNYKLPVKPKFENVALSDHLKPTSFGHERHSTYKLNNWNNNTNTCGWTDTYYNNPYPSYPTLNKILPYFNNNYYSYPPPPPPPPPPLKDLKHAPLPNKDIKHVKPIPMKHTNVKKKPEPKNCLGNSQKSEIKTSKLIEQPYSPPVLPIPTFYDVFKLLDKRSEAYNKSRLRVKRGERAVVSGDCIPKKITLHDYLSKKKPTKDFNEGE